MKKFEKNGSLVKHEYFFFPDVFWLPAACGGAALEANIDVVVVVVGAMSFTQDCLF